MEIYLDPEEQITCPYNNSHRIRRKVMNTHLVRCKKSYPESKLVECDFNVIHKIPEPELQYHHEHCPDRKKIEITIYQENKTDLNKFPVHNIHVPTEETWDNDNVATYDPKKNCENRDVIRGLDVESSAKKRNFRMEERQRMAQVTNKNLNNKPGIPKPSTSRVGTNSNIKRELPQTQSRVIDEETPDSIADIVQRIRIGANQPYIPKQK